MSDDASLQTAPVKMEVDDNQITLDRPEEPEQTGHEVGGLQNLPYSSLEKSTGPMDTTTFRPFRRMQENSNW